MTYVRKTLPELLSREEPAWPLVQSWIADAIRPVQILPPADDAGDSLVSLQITTRSPLGAVVLNTGGVLIDHGWLRFLASGHSRLRRSLPEWNFQCGLSESETAPTWLLIADDVLGGFFALNGGRFSPVGHTVWYFAPDSLEWEDTELGYTDFLCWSLTGDVDGFYSSYRWSGWQEEVAAVGGDEGLSIAPPLCTEGPEIALRSRRAVPIAELFSLYVGAIGDASIASLVRRLPGPGSDS